ncbi:Protein-tyrosine phosphatase containing protein [Aphelenchoides fujianensis]|nr:Protein-tyrosine phosphatase containing protein [Aphelenchoides fujianensis]
MEPSTPLSPPQRSHSSGRRSSPVLFGLLLLAFSGLPFVSGFGHQNALPAPLKANKLGVPYCLDHNDCVVGGVCLRDELGVGRCMCSSSCPLNVPVQCMPEKNSSCVSMGETYMRKYDLHPPVCHMKRCICPPIFDPIPVQPPIAGFKAMLPMKCDKRDLNAMILASPSDSAYKGAITTLFCCVNLDPRAYIAENGVYFVQNGTRKREPTSSPYDNFSRDVDTLFTVPTCWSLTLNNVQPSDSGTYTCIVQPMNAKYKTINTTMEFAVKTPRTIHNVTITPNSTSTTIKWETSEDPMLRIDLELFRRSDRKTRVWRKSNAKSPVLIENLNPATPYTLFISVVDGQAEPFKLTEQFQTSEGAPDPPDLEDIRLINGENGRIQVCELEWKPPRWTRGHITRYFVQVKGHLRYQSPNNAIALADDLPHGVDMCSNYDGNDLNSIDPQMFHNFFACKYGPLKPNRNYSATIWAETKAGRSEPVSYKRQCVMDFAEPDHIEPPETSPRTNGSSFGLRFTHQPNEINGPIACYYLAIVPLPANTSINSLPAPELIVMDTYDKALQNNLHSSAAENNRYFAYIAESYMEYPTETVIGDGDPRGGVAPCNVLYLTRYKPNDAALAVDLKYTGFLIARVDRDRGLQHQQPPPAGSGDPRRFRPVITEAPPLTAPAALARSMGAGRAQRAEISATLHAPNGQQSTGRPRRQLLTSGDPAYGFSNYFKPVILQPADGGDSPLLMILITILLVLMAVLAVGTLVYFLYKKGLIANVCLLKKDHTMIRQTYDPVPVEDLPTEYVIRHKDSDFLFSAEFDALPRSKVGINTASDRPENLRKNRYNDIRALDETRVKLEEIGRIPGTDYVNGNYIKGYNGQKTFIATQGPLENTVTDFWRMVYEKQCRIIVMVTNLRERGRDQCAKYWPDEEDSAPVNVGNMFEVHSIHSDYFADYTLREFLLQPTGAASPQAAHSKSPSRETQQPSSPLLSPNSPTQAHPNGYSPHSRTSFSIESPRRTPTRGANRSESMSSPSPRPESDYANLPRANRPASSHSQRSHAPNGDAVRVLQYHFTSWNDYRAPECTVGLLRLICKLRKMDEYNSYPVVVHCSAGVGRTGTFIAIDYVLDQCLNEGKADVFGCVAKLRAQRNLMVQSLEQYVFIYKALAEHHLFGTTDLTPHEFRQHYNRLRAPLARRERHQSVGPQTDEKCNGNGVAIARAASPPASPTFQLPGGSKADGVFNQKLKQMRRSTSPENSRQTNAEAEFARLNTSLEKPRSTQFAQRDQNRGRNRSEEGVPYDFNRVILQHLLDYENTYINASVVKGYFAPFIFAQDPLGPETAFDFWRMVNEQNSCTIVNLTDEALFTRSEKYWPVDANVVEYLGLKQELILQLNHDSSHGREVVQFTFRKWPSADQPPTDISAFLDLIAEVMDRQAQVPESGPIVLHCRNGSTETGMFGAVYLLAERLRAERMIDVFHTVKTLQLQRPLLVNRLDQYTFIYDAIAEFLRTSFI